jgi:hypothetical protein
MKFWSGSMFGVVAANQILAYRTTCLLQYDGVVVCICSNREAHPDMPVDYNRDLLNISNVPSLPSSSRWNSSVCLWTPVEVMKVWEVVLTIEYRHLLVAIHLRSRGASRARGLLEVQTGQDFLHRSPYFFIHPFITPRWALPNPQISLHLRKYWMLPP